MAAALAAARLPEMLDAMRHEVRQAEATVHLGNRYKARGLEVDPLFRLLHLASTLKTYGQGRELAEVYDSHIDQHSNDCQTLQRGIALVEEGINDHKANSRSNPESLLLCRYKLALLFYQTGRANEAIHLLEDVAEEASTLDPQLEHPEGEDFTEACVTVLARWYMQTDNQEEAISLYEETAELPLETSAKDSYTRTLFGKELVRPQGRLARARANCEVIERTVQAQRARLDRSAALMRSAESTLDYIRNLKRECEESTGLLEMVAYSHVELIERAQRARDLETWQRQQLAERNSTLAGLDTP